MKVKNQICNAYFKGIDGLGTCDDKCQWESKDCPCGELKKGAEDD